MTRRAEPPATLQWQTVNGSLYAYTLRLRARRRGLLPAEERVLFAVARPTVGADGIVDSRPGHKWIAHRATVFDDLNTFDTREEAVVYIQSLYALNLD